MNNNLTKEIKVVTDKVVLYHAHVFMPWAYNAGANSTNTPKYSVIIIISKENLELIKIINEAIDEAVVQAKEIFSNVQFEESEIIRPLKDGDGILATDEMYKNSYYMSVSSMLRPNVVDKQLRLFSKTEASINEHYGRVSMIFQAYNYKGRIGITAKLKNVQVYNERFNRSGLQSNPEEDFS